MAADLLSDVSAALSRACDAHTEAQGLVAVLQERIDDQAIEAAELRRLVTVLLGYFRQQRRLVLITTSVSSYEHIDTRIAQEVAKDPILVRASAIADEFTASVDAAADQERISA